MSSGPGSNGIAGRSNVMTKRSDSSEGETDEYERAYWFYRLFHGKEPNEAEVRTLVNQVKSQSTQKFLFYAIAQPDFNRGGASIQNIMLDYLYRKRVTLVRPTQRSTVRPNVFVIGQARSGTTSLHEYFMEHPQVFVPMSKETNYYSHWSEVAAGESGLRYSDYLMYFADATTEKARCDISPFYVSEPGVALRIFRDTPDAKIILFLRNPIDLIVSKYNLDHDERSGGGIDQWIMQGISQFRASQPRWAHDSCVTVLFHCMISHNLREYKRYFGDKLKVYIFDDMVADQEKVYKEICKFVGIDFIYDHKYWSWKSPRTARPSKETAHALADFLLPEVKQIEDVLGCDLSRWYSRWPQQG